MTPRPNKIARRPFIAELLQHRGDALIVTGLGSPTWDCFAAGDSREHHIIDLRLVVLGGALHGVELATDDSQTAPCPDRLVETRPRCGLVGQDFAPGRQRGIRLVESPPGVREP